MVEKAVWGELQMQFALRPATPRGDKLRATGAINPSHTHLANCTVHSVVNPEAAEGNMFVSCAALNPPHALAGSDEMSSAVLSANIVSGRLFTQPEVNSANDAREIDASMALVSDWHDVLDNLDTHCGVMLTKANNGILAIRHMPGIY